MAGEWCTAYTADFLYSPLYIKVALYRAMAQVVAAAGPNIEAAELRHRLHIRLEDLLSSPHPRTHPVDPVRGQADMIDFINAARFTCNVCSSHEMQTGRSFQFVLSHLSSKKHGERVLARLRRKQHLRRRLRLIARLAGCVTLWHARAVQRTYAPGGAGYNMAQASFEAHARSL